MLLFLDFDGVTHPTKSLYGPFTQLDLIQELLLETPDLEVVISSSWRQHYSLQELKDFFIEPIQHQIVGVTPTLSFEVPAYRQREIEAWVVEHRPNALWLALDDQPSLFDVDCSQVMLCDSTTGLQAHQMDLLKLRLSNPSSGPSY